MREQKGKIGIISTYFSFVCSVKWMLFSVNLMALKCNQQQQQREAVVRYPVCLINQNTFCLPEKPNKTNKSIEIFTFHFRIKKFIVLFCLLSF